MDLDGCLYVDQFNLLAICAYQHGYKSWILVQSVSYMYISAWIHELDSSSIC